MLSSVHPKLPMRDKISTRNYYVNQLGFTDIGAEDYPDYLIIQKDQVQIHFFAFAELDPRENYGQIYIRTDNIREWYQYLLDHKVAIHPNGHLAEKPWGQWEFALLDPDHNLLTFGQSIS